MSLPLQIVVIGASGDLAGRKIFPALFALQCQGLLSDDVQYIGYARSPFTDDAFRRRIEEKLTCRYVPGESCSEHMEDFLERCRYVAGSYDELSSFVGLRELLDGMAGGQARRLFYLAVPPGVYTDIARCLHGVGLISAPEDDAWSRLVIEKPFGRDSGSFDELDRELSRYLDERQTFRIDHYLGKELVQNLMVLRFANTIFEPMWNRNYIKGVQISFLEELGVVGRGGYFDQFGIIRDVMQNHLLQMLALVAMEPPADIKHFVRDEKVKALRSIEAVGIEDAVVGQYGAGTWDGKDWPAYIDDSTVPEGSASPTYAEVKLCIRNRRWDGVPFLLRAGKGVGKRLAEIRIQFERAPGRLFEGHVDELPTNELVIRVQPDEAIYFTTINKAPGLKLELVTSDINLQYADAFKDDMIPDAYESLLVDVIKGEQGLFIRRDELAASWDVFTPLLNALEASKKTPQIYPFGRLPDFGFPFSLCTS